MNKAIKWAAELTGVEEASVLGMADLNYWADYLRPADLLPAERDGNAQILMIISGGMIAQAQSKYTALDFRHLAAEELNFEEEFDVVFCNSSMQWFKDPEKAVRAMCAALRPGGRIGVSCPATENWSTCFKGVATEAGAQPDVAATFARWKSPWFYLADERAYQRLFEAAGLQTLSCQIVLEEYDYATEQAVEVFMSGAAQGYTGKEFYEVAIDDDYIRRFNDHARRAIERRARKGTVVVDFRRLFYIGNRP